MALYLTINYLRNDFENKIEFLLDTGASLSVISADIVRKNGALGLINKSRVQMMNTAGGMKKTLGEITMDVTIGNHSFPGMVFTVIEGDHCLLGMTFLTPHRAIIDVCAGELTLREGPSNIVIPLHGQTLTSFTSVRRIPQADMDIIDRIMGNIRKNPGNERYKSIPMSSTVIKKLSPISIEHLCGLGFERVDAHMMFVE